MTVPKHADRYSHIVYLVFLQVFVERIISRYRSMRRRRVTCWFAQTVSPLWYETADRRNTAPASAKRSRRTSTAGESLSLGFLEISLWSLRGPSILFLYSCADAVFTYFCCLSFVHLSTTSRVFPQGFQLSAA